jgi:4-diphosphocytidyl-2-C-methyl-D-erythritol kinase
MPAAAKLNLSLVVGPRRSDGFHEVATLMQRIDLCDRLELRRASELSVRGFAGDTLVAQALRLLAAEAGVEPGFEVTLEKQIPVAAGLGGGSADAAASLALANRLLPEPFSEAALYGLAARLGSDVPFFLEPGPKLATGRGETLEPVDVPQDYVTLVAIERGAVKRSTAEVYGRFDALHGAAGFEERRAKLREAIAGCRLARDLAALPGNDLAEASGGSRLPVILRHEGAFRADVSGAGPAVYGLFTDRRSAKRAARALPSGTRSWLAAAVW